MDDPRPQAAEPRRERSFAAPLVNFLHYDQLEDADADEALPPETVIDVSHEAFVRQWQRLRDWIVEIAARRRL